MPDFQYQAIRRDGSAHHGSLTADTQEAAARELRRRGLTPIRIAPASAGAPLAPPPSSGRKKIGVKDLLSVTSELAVLLRSGLPLDRALKVIIGFIQHENLKIILQGTLEKVKGGKSFSQALEDHRDAFGDFYINMIRSGEAGGQLPEVLTQLTDHLERTKALRQSVISALIYPAILIIVAILSVAMLLVFVVPQFESLFSDMGEALPTPTRAILAATHMLKEWGWIIAAATALIFILWNRWQRTAAGQAWRDARLLTLPLLGPLMRQYEITRFARTMGTLLHNGVSLLESLEIATATMGNSVLREAMTPVASRIKQGSRIAQSMEPTDVLPPLGLHMIQIGEETGRLDMMFLELARVYDDEVQTGVKRALTFLEPLLILTLGAVIALIIISILMGILSVNELAV